MIRREFIKQGVLGGGALMLGSYTQLSAYGNKQPQRGIFIDQDLPIPPLAEYKRVASKKEFSLETKEGTKSFFENTSTKTFGVNGDFLGPTIKVNNGDEIKIDVKNSLNEDTSMHWHGLHVEGKDDGGPHQLINPYRTWSPEFKIDQRACTAWYHPHQMDRTGYQVYMGVSGFFLIDDESSKNLPHEYGIDDIPLVIQDRRFDNSGELEYILSMHDKMMGMRGDTFLINGAIAPTFKAKKELVRFRILNGSNARIYALGFHNGMEFDVVGSDGGLFQKPQRTSKILLSPGERIEIVVRFEKNQEIALFDYISRSSLMKVATKNLEKSPYLPEEIAEPFEIVGSKDEKIRYFDLSMRRGAGLINNKKMDMSRIDEEVELGKSEIWRIRSNQRMMMRMPHPFHMHGCSFLILRRDGRPIYSFEKGAKDTVLIGSGEVADVRVIFHKKADRDNPYMYHCHNLEHKELGMMGQFTVG